jgi:hypothetical protein
MENVPKVHSLYWKNISPAIIESQEAAFKYLDIPLFQQEIDRKDHGQWMTEILEESDDDDIVLFCDIDAFPLNRYAYERSVVHAHSGGIFGLAQFSNHIPTSEIYAGPMFMAVRKNVWTQLGSPNLSASNTADAAEILSIRARQFGVPLLLSKPICCIDSKWALANEGVFGIGTFYGDFEFFHLFEARKKSSINLMKKVVDDLVCSRPFDFHAYLNLMLSENLCDRLVERIESLRRSVWRRIFA